MIRAMSYGGGVQSTALLVLAARREIDFPLALIRDLAGLCPDGGTVLDPFAGSGTTLRAAKDLGRKSIGIEISPEYCEIAARRLAQSVLPLTIAG